MEKIENSKTDVVSTIIETYDLLSPLGATKNRIVGRIIDYRDAIKGKTYTFRSTYDYVEVIVYSKDIIAFNTDGDLIEGKATAHDSSIGSTRLFSDYAKASEFARSRCNSQKYLNAQFDTRKYGGVYF